MINVSQKIKVAVSHLLRSQMELDVEDYGLKSLSDLCNRILARYAKFTPPDPTQIGADDTLYKNVPPLQFSLNQAGESFANFANSFAKNAGTKIATLCRYYFECYVNMPRGKRECFIFRDELDKLNAAAKARANVSLTYRGERKCVSPCFLAFSPSQVRAYVVVCDDKVECAEKLAKVYFPQFLSDADVLEPRDLRLWFKEEFEKAAGVYKGI